MVNNQKIPQIYENLELEWCNLWHDILNVQGLLGFISEALADGDDGLDAKMADCVCSI